VDNPEDVVQKISRERSIRNLPPIAEQQIILVGSNPLPCYVAALAFHPSLVIPVCTRETFEIGTRLNYALEKKEIQCRSPVEIKAPSNADNVYAAIRAIPDLARCGLHYTGGKKTMSVHAYRAWKDRARDITQASYIDAQDMALIFDGTPLRIDLRYGPALDIDTLFSLHGIRPHSTTGYKGGPQIEGLADLAFDYVRENGPASLQDAVSPEFSRFPSQMKSFFDAHYKRASDSYTLDQFYCDYLGYPDNALASIPGKKKTEKVGKWLRGEWLEEYVWTQIRSMADEEGLTDVVFDINMLTRGDMQFQVDVACLRGHTLLVFSCTTEDSRNDVLKNKLFEAQIRARQLGGDHARYAFISLAPKGLATGLEREVKEAWDGMEHFRVFGWDDVTGGLGERLRDWIRKV
jgi:hypothetical protein